MYEQPNSHFVADFIGDANIVPVTIESRQGEMASVRLGPLLLTLPHHGAVEGAAELSIRPQALLLAPGGDGLSGHVTKAAYLGDHMEYWVTVTGLDKELFAIAIDVERPLVVGNMVSVSLAPYGSRARPAALTAGTLPAKPRSISQHAVPPGCVGAPHFLAKIVPRSARCMSRMGRLSGVAGYLLSRVSTTTRFCWHFRRERPHIRARIAEGSSLPVEAGKGSSCRVTNSKSDRRCISCPIAWSVMSPGGAYTIQRALPDEGRDLQYRVKNVQDGHERVVSEAQLRPAEALTPHH